MEKENEKKTTFHKEDLTGKAEQSEAAIEQTERERDNKGVEEVHPELTKEKEGLKEAPESLKNSK
ncbi:MAG TPA: hypothetical protein VJ720_09790 [Chitinophaga sp.]|nr:hypothetical protein [Chitinophaga sp.]